MNFNNKINIVISSFLTFFYLIIYIITYIIIDIVTFKLLKILWIKLFDLIEVFIIFVNEKIDWYIEYFFVSFGVSS